MFLLAAISLGFLGSFHCIGMCGPIALAIPVKNNSYKNRVFSALAYNVGRIITYAGMGLVFGLLGKGFFLAGWQNILSIALGMAILLLLFFPKAFSLSGKTKIVSRLLGKVKLKIRTLFEIHTLSSLLLIGLLNGFLPCGLIYLGIAGAIATGDGLNGALFMATFGLGTLPAMLTLTVLREYIGLRFREKIRRTVPVLVGVMALLLILRGLNLGIPYVSPSIDIKNGLSQHECCHK